MTPAASRQARCNSPAHGVRTNPETANTNSTGSKTAVKARRLPRIQISRLFDVTLFDNACPLGGIHTGRAGINSGVDRRTDFETP